MELVNENEALKGLDTLSLLMYTELYIMVFLYRSRMRQDKVFVLDDALFLQGVTRNHDLSLLGQSCSVTHVVIRAGKGILPINSSAGSMVKLALLLGKEKCGRCYVTMRSSDVDIGRSGYCLDCNSITCAKCVSAIKLEEQGHCGTFKCEHGFFRAITDLLIFAYETVVRANAKKAAAENLVDKMARL